MKCNGIRLLAISATLATGMFVGAPQLAFAQTAPSPQATMASLSSQIGVGDFAAARATIANLQNSGITAIQVGGQTVSLSSLVAMIAAAQAGQTDPNDLAAYFDALAANSAQAFYVPPPGGDSGGYDHTEPTVPDINVPGPEVDPTPEYEPPT